MKSFKRYAKEAQPKNESATAEELTQKIAQAYMGKSSTDIFQEILAEAEKSKRAGTLSNEEIDRFCATFSPMLDSAQKKRLQSVVERLKEI